MDATEDDFIGRDRELAVLEEAYEGAGSAFIPVYGRRRVGKSELILQLLRGRRGVYHVGKQSAAGLMVREFLTEAAAVLEEPLLATFPADGWRAALAAVVERFRGPGKLILALDEFQWTAGASPELPSVLQELWDRSWRRSGKVMLILCGSFIGFMEREVLGKNSPLFGRRTAQILLRPFDFREAARFHPSLSLVDRAVIYFLCGGVPLYLRAFSARASTEANLCRAILDEHGPLYREADFLLREELRDVENYYGVLLALASGHTQNRDIARFSGVAERSLHYYLKQLSDLGYVKTRYPLTGGKRVARYVRYTIEDPLLRFWFRFVFPNTSYIAQMGPKRALYDRIRPELPAFYGAAFERLCREALPMLYEEEGVTAAFSVGEYWDRSMQIDVVGLRDDGWIDLGECKWGAVRSASALASELERKAASYPNPRNATLGRRFFTRDAVPGRSRRDAPGVRWHTLADLYGEAPRRRRRS
jgi:AAA+ ATPase superfamily predicted ATPase